MKLVKVGSHIINLERVTYIDIITTGQLSVIIYFSGAETGNHSSLTSGTGTLESTKNHRLRLQNNNARAFCMYLANNGLLDIAL